MKNFLHPLILHTITILSKNFLRRELCDVKYFIEKLVQNSPELPTQSE